MKRMYVTLAIMLSLLLWAVTGFGQKKVPRTTDRPEDSFQQKLQLRDEIHRRMMNKLLHGMGPDEDLFKDLEQMMDESMKDSFSGFDSLDSIDSIGGRLSSSYQAEWQESDLGRTLVLTPQSPEQQLDINVQNNLVTIKGKKEVKSAQGSSQTSFANSFSVPADCDGARVKIQQKDGKILIELPYRQAKKVSSPRKEERTPIKPDKSDVTI